MFLVAEGEEGGFWLAFSLDGWDNLICVTQSFEYLSSF
jgi:hypothetical protein